ALSQTSISLVGGGSRLFDRGARSPPVGVGGTVAPRGRPRLGRRGRRVHGARLGGASDRAAARLLLARPSSRAPVRLLDAGRRRVGVGPGEGRGDRPRRPRRLLGRARRARPRAPVRLARRCRGDRRAARLRRLLPLARRARADLQPLSPARGPAPRGRAPRARRPGRRSRARGPGRRREPSDDEAERVRLRDRADAARRPLRHVARRSRRGAAPARRRARARAPARASRREVHRRGDARCRGLDRGALGGARVARRIAARPADRPARVDGAPHRRAAARRGCLAALRARRRPLLARADAGPAGLRARAPDARALEPRRPRAAAARVLAGLLASDDAGAARLRAGVGGGRVVHSHSHSRAHDRRLLAVALGLILALMAGEIAAGLVAGSLALLADAGHLLTDAAALAGALVAARLATRPARGQWTFGLGRAEILAAQGNGITLLVVAVWIVYGAVRRLVSPPVVHGGVVVVVALAGVAINVVVSLVLARADRENLNVRGAFLHVVTDLAAFIGTAAAGALILATGWYRFDAI